MKESLVAAIGIWLVFVLVFASLVGAQTGQAPVPASKVATIAKTEVSGKKSVDPAGTTVLLEDGTQLMIPGSVNVNPAALTAGAR
jgi:hypothetical protein